MADETGQVLSVPDPNAIATKEYVDSLITPERQRWQYSNDTIMDDPGLGRVRFNFKRMNNLTQMAVSVSAAVIPPFTQGTDITAALSRYKAGDELYIQVQEDSTRWGRYVVAADPVFNGPWAQIGISWQAAGESFLIPDATLVLQFQQVGNVLGPPLVAVPLPSSSVIEPE